MANEINGIGINTGLVNGYNNTPKGDKPEGIVDEPTPQAAPAQTQVSADDVLAYMAYSSIGVNHSVPRTYDVSRYVTPEQAARIAGFVAGFEGEVAKALQALEEEGINLPEDQKYEIAAAMATA